LLSPTSIIPKASLITMPATRTSLQVCRSMPWMETYEAPGSQVRSRSGRDALRSCFVVKMMFILYDCLLPLAGVAVL
jgi:hypothetical protein